jgi:hypothetical protein
MTIIQLKVERVKMKLNLDLANHEYCSLDALEKRIGQQKDRITSIKQFKRFIGKKVFIVTCPVVFDNEKAPVYSGNSFVNYWKVGNLYDVNGEDITHETKYSSYYRLGIYNVDLTRKKIRQSKLTKPIIDIINYNVIPDKYSMNAMFFTEQGAKGYQIWLKMVYDNNRMLDNLPKYSINDIFQGLYIEWEDFIKNN